MEQTTRFTYVGPASHADDLADELRTRGLTPDSARPEPTKDLDTVVGLVAVLFSVTGPLPDILAGVQAFKTRRPTARIQGLETDGPRSATERLAQIEMLHAMGSITDEERAEQRTRVLGEL